MFAHSGVARKVSSTKWLEEPLEVWRPMPRPHPCAWIVPEALSVQNEPSQRGSTHTSRDILTNEFPLSLLLAARDSITAATAKLAAMGVMAQPPMYASAKSGKNKNHGNSKGKHGGAAAGAKGSTPPAPKSA